MSALNHKTENTTDREIVTTRLFDASRELVWKAWTTPELLAKWYGPNGFTLTTHSMDIKPGGSWNFTMHGPDGKDYPNKISYLEVVKPERLVYLHGGAGARVTVTFEDVKGKTNVTMQMVFNTAAEREKVVKEHNAVEGAKQTFARLAGQLEKDSVIIERVFDAPVATVWKAITDFKQMRQWYFSKLEAFEAKVGFHTEVSVEHNGKDILHIWNVTEVIPQKKLTYSWEYADNKGKSFVTFELFAQGDKTKLILTHTGLATFEHGGKSGFVRSDFVKGWTYFSGTLKEFVEKPPH